MPPGTNYLRTVNPTAAAAVESGSSKQMNGRRRFVSTVLEARANRVLDRLAVESPDIQALTHRIASRATSSIVYQHRCHEYVPVAKSLQGLS
jgi:hypothetical protein